MVEGNIQTYNDVNSRFCCFTLILFQPFLLCQASITVTKSKARTGSYVNEMQRLSCTNNSDSGFYLYDMSVLVPYQTVHAFPCAGGSGTQYCRAYHLGVVQADKDDVKGNVDVSQHPCSGTADYCSGYTPGYDDEAGIL